MACKGDLDAVAALAESYEGEPCGAAAVAVEADFHHELADTAGRRGRPGCTASRCGSARRTCDLRRTWAVAEAAIYEAALAKNHPPDRRAGYETGFFSSGLVGGLLGVGEPGGCRPWS